MKVLQIVKTNVGATWAYNQAKWLFENGVDIITVLPSLSGGWAEKYKENGMKIIEGDFSLPIKNPWTVFDKITNLRKIVKEVKPDIVHCHFVTNVMMLRIALRDSKIPRLFQVPGPLHLESFIFRYAEILLAGAKDYWAGSCKKTCEIYLKAGLAEKKIFLAYYGCIVGDLISEFKDNSNILHSQFKISNDKILIGMISYFYKPKRIMFQTRGLKGHEDFIDAIALVRKKNPLCIGVIIGGSWGESHSYFEKVKRYAYKKCKDGIVFTGFRNDVKDIYKELNIAVHPSHSENLGGAGESLSAGVPTISTNVGGFPDIVIDGVTGYTVNPKSPLDLANTIEKINNDPLKANAMAKAGQDLVRNLLDINSTASNVLNIYKDILNKFKNKEL